MVDVPAHRAISCRARGRTFRSASGPGARNVLRNLGRRRLNLCHLPSFRWGFLSVVFASGFAHLFSPGSC